MKIKKTADTEDHLEKVKEWNIANKEHDLRLKYQLTSNSIVFDLGAYKGEWSFKIWKKYKCNIYAFEPIFEFYNEAYHVLNNEEVTDKSNKKIKIFNFAMGGQTRHEDISYINDGSSFFIESGKTESVHIRDIVEVIEELKIKRVSLIKMNIEGSEYEVLERLIEKNMLGMFDNFQIQFHREVKDYKSKRKAIQDELRKTHKCAYNFEFVWESWSKK